MRKQMLTFAFGLVWAAGAIMPDVAYAQANSVVGSDGTKSGLSNTSFDSLKGRWVRPDGGYAITIRSIDADGKLDADYANPKPLPFAKAEATRDGNTINVFFELTAGGYNGSTYTLSLDPTKDVLKGTYFQAVARQKYEIYFARGKQ